MTEDKGRSTSIGDLCDDLTVDILRRLPLDWIFPCLYVCRRWRYLITRDPVLQNYSATVATLSDHQHGHRFIILETICGARSNHENPELDLSIDFAEKSRYNYRVLASWNGLLFSYVFVPGFPELDQCFISNPWIKDSLSLPKPTKLSSTSICGLAFDKQRLVPSSRTYSSYKIVILQGCPLSATYRFEVYSSDTRKWQLLERTACRHQLSGRAVYCKGVLYWQCRDIDLALVFNPVTELPYYLELPSEEPHYSIISKISRRALAECHGRLHYVRISYDSRRLHVWKESTSGTWLALHGIDLEGAVGRSLDLFPMSRRNFPIFSPIDMSCQVDGIRILIGSSNGTQIVSYDLKREVFELVHSCRAAKWLSFFRYSPTTKLICER